MGSDAATWAPIKDAIGSTLALLDSSGNLAMQYTYDPFGNRAANGQMPIYPFTFAGMDSNGPLYHTFARDYSSQLTRFISEDPLGFDGGSANLFTYGSNNPVSNTDPLGECDIAGCGDFAGEQGSTVARSGEGGSPFSLEDWINSIISFFSDLFGGGGSQPVVIPRKRRHRAHIIQIQYWGGSADEIMDQQQNAPGMPRSVIVPIMGVNPEGTQTSRECNEA
ncbi:MAG TPA: RHS repeat-associated core domain-containing protein, partial [Candidatus Binataceae bacterium]|nr:RHS repeat-associated core domain-containing protein [Candidatus Binataceae bacterium]